jgi:hypothetical protein
VEIDGGLKDTDRVIILDGKIGLKIKDGLRVKSVPAEQKGDMK